MVLSKLWLSENTKIYPLLYGLPVCKLNCLSPFQLGKNKKRQQGVKLNTTFQWIISCKQPQTLTKMIKFRKERKTWNSAINFQLQGRFYFGKEIFPFILSKINCRKNYFKQKKFQVRSWKFFNNFWKCLQIHPLHQQEVLVY
jgi:hypothetical protein